MQVNLVLDEGRSLGLMIRGGSEYALGIYITGVDKDSEAENTGLKVSSAEILGWLREDLHFAEMKMHRYNFWDLSGDASFTLIFFLKKVILLRL